MTAIPKRSRITPPTPPATPTSGTEATTPIERDMKGTPGTKATIINTAIIEHTGINITPFGCHYLLRVMGLRNSIICIAIVRLWLPIQAPPLDNPTLL